MTAIPSDPPPRLTLWKAAQWIGVVATVLLLVGMVVRPRLSLTILWNVLIPLVPASLLISPAIWRNVCPLATLSTVTNRAAGKNGLSPAWVVRTGIIGIVLLVILVPARRVLFNTDAPVLAATVVVIATLALVLGTQFPLKAGFCNGICPVLPVERLYGQHPLIQVGNARCLPSCTMCTSRGCIDLAPTKAMAQTLGVARRSRAWLTNWYGVFAAGFPGFVIGYYTSRDGPLTTVAEVYVHVLGWAAVSYLLTVAIGLVTKATADRALPVLAAVAAGLYYWFAAEAVTAAFEIPGVTTLLIRASALALVAYWLRRATPRSATA